MIRNGVFKFFQIIGRAIDRAGDFCNRVGDWFRNGDGTVAIVSRKLTDAAFTGVVMAAAVLFTFQFTLGNIISAAKFDTETRFEVLESKLTGIAAKLENPVTCQTAKPPVKTIKKAAR